jgi:hypothetical protein
VLGMVIEWERGDLQSGRKNHTRTPTMTAGMPSSTKSLIES